MASNIKRVDYSERFIKILKRVPIEIKNVTAKRIELFFKNPYHMQLHNHQLTGIYKGVRSINITGDWRALFSESINEDGERIIIFHILGTHSQLYK